MASRGRSSTRRRGEGRPRGLRPVAAYRIETPKARSKRCGEESHRSYLKPTATMVEEFPEGSSIAGL